jgi:hypothetical protein
MKFMQNLELIKISTNNGLDFSEWAQCLMFNV